MKTKRGAMLEERAAHDKSDNDVVGFEQCHAVIGAIKGRG